jgi:hypothetical protein
MKYFTYELIAAANDWVEQDKREVRRAEKRLDTAVRQYRHELESLKTRISQPAWKFFRYGFGNKGLHDARLLSFRIGDGLDYEPDGKAPFRLNAQRTSATLEFLNYEQDLHYVFQLRGIASVSCDLFPQEDSYAKSLGDLYIYELTRADNDNLRLGFLFASSATIVAEFQRLVFRMKRLQRRYEIGETYD